MSFFDSFIWLRFSLQKGLCWKFAVSGNKLFKDNIIFLIYLGVFHHFWRNCIHRMHLKRILLDNTYLVLILICWTKSLDSFRQLVLVSKRLHGVSSNLQPLEVLLLIFLNEMGRLRSKMGIKSEWLGLVHQLLSIVLLLLGSPFGSLNIERILKQLGILPSLRIWNGHVILRG